MKTKTVRAGLGAVLLAALVGCGDVTPGDPEPTGAGGAAGAAGGASGSGDPGWHGAAGAAGSAPDADGAAGQSSGGAGGAAGATAGAAGSTSTGAAGAPGYPVCTEYRAYDDGTCSFPDPKTGNGVDRKKDGHVCVLCAATDASGNAVANPVNCIIPGIDKLLCVRSCGECS